MKEVRSFQTNRAPKPAGCYSQAVKAGDFLFTAGQLPIDPASGEFVYGDVQTQTTCVLDNLKAIVEDAGYSLKDVVKTTVFIRSIDQWPQVNEIYAGYFRDTIPPARSIVAGADIHFGLDIEVEAVVYTGAKE